jgi:hypothetical protein
LRWRSISKQTRATTGARQAQPGLLHRVFGFACRAQHAVGHGAQMPAIGIKSLGQKNFFVHRSHSLLAFRHGHDERIPADVTRDRFRGSGVKIIRRKAENRT